MERRRAEPNPGISFVFPCLNEEASVGHCVREALESARVLGVSAEVIVVDNGSSDGSAQAAQAAGATVIALPEKGYGAALLSGMAAARHAYIITGDSDGQHQYSPDNVGRIHAALEDGADFVNGNRFHGNNPHYRLPLPRRAGNRLFSVCFNRLYGARLHDVTCGMNGYRAVFFRRLSCRSKGMELNIELRALHMLARARMAEADLRCGERFTGHSHVRLLHDGTMHLWTMFAMRRRRHG